MTNRNCKICNKKFTTKSNRQIFCSKGCSAKGHKISRDRFNHSPKGKELKQKYAKSPKGKAVIKLKQTRYDKSIEGKISRKKYRSTDKGKSSNRFSTAKRRIDTRQATPPWNDEIKTKKIYDYASKIELYLNKNLKTKIAKVHVDHIIPLKGKMFDGGYSVCGLNVWYNLMPSLESDNTSKRNICPPEKQLKKIKMRHISLDILPQPANWMKFVHSMYKHVIRSSGDKIYKKQLMSSYVEMNPRNIKK